MSETFIYNLSSRPIPANAKITVRGEPKPGDVLVIETCSGATGTANWRSTAHVEAWLAQQASAAKAAPMRERAPYS